MNRRMMKKKIKEFLARKFFLDLELQEEFAIWADLEPLTNATHFRFNSVILELHDEWIK